MSCAARKAQHSCAVTFLEIIIVVVVVVVVVAALWERVGIKSWTRGENVLECQVM